MCLLHTFGLLTVHKHMEFIHHIEFSNGVETTTKWFQECIATNSALQTNCSTTLSSTLHCKGKKCFL